MKKAIWGIAAILVLSMVAPAAWACSYTFDVSLVKISVDSVRSSANTLGFDDWYVWKYRVDVIAAGPSNATDRGLSNWVLQLPSCYITSKDLFKEIETSAGFGGGDRIRVYDPEAVDYNGNPQQIPLDGLKFDWKQSCLFSDQLDRVGEYDYFWFSAPTDESIDVDWGVKAGQKKVFGDVEGPACPDCEDPDPGVPEPMSMVLFGAGLAGMALRKRRSGA